MTLSQNHSHPNDTQKNYLTPFKDLDRASEVHDFLSAALQESGLCDASRGARPQDAIPLLDSDDDGAIIVGGSYNDVLGSESLDDDKGDDPAEKPVTSPADLARSVKGRLRRQAERKKAKLTQSSDPASTPIPMTQPSDLPEQARDTTQNSNSEQPSNIISPEQVENSQQDDHTSRASTPLSSPPSEMNKDLESSQMLRRSVRLTSQPSQPSQPLPSEAEKQGQPLSVPSKITPASKGRRQP